MPNTITSTTVPHFIAEGPLAVVHEVADIFEQADVSHSPLAAGLHTGKSFQDRLRLPADR